MGSQPTGAGICSIDASISSSAPVPATMIIGMFVVVIGYFLSQLTSRVRARHQLSQGICP